MAKEFTGVYEITRIVDGVKRVWQYKVTDVDDRMGMRNAWAFSETLPGKAHLVKLVASAYN